MANTPIDLDALLQGYARRGGSTGGFLKGAISGAGTGSTVATLGGPLTAFGGGLFGGIAGGIKGAIQKKAATAPTDLSVADASDAIGKGYQQMFGRAASPSEIHSMLAGQGLKPGDRYVGSGGIQGILSNLSTTPEAQAYATQGQAPRPTAGGTGMEMTDTRRSVMDSLRSGTPNKDALIRLMEGR